MINSESNPTLVNCILWGNSPNSLMDDEESSSTVTYSDVEWSGGVHPGAGNINADPSFGAPAAASEAPTTTGNYRLRCDSPAIDAGLNGAVPADVTTDLDGNERFRGPVDPVEKPPVDMGPYEEQAYGDWVLEGFVSLHEGQAYRTGFHVVPEKTITATIDAYTSTYFIDAIDLYGLALTCAPTEDRQEEAGTGWLNAHWELATGEMLMGNEAMVQSMDMRFTAEYPGLTDQIGKLEEALDHYSRGVTAYLDILPSEFFTVAMGLQPSRVSPLDETSAPYIDVQRLAQATARRSRASLEVAERQFRLFTAAGKGAAEETLRQGFEEALVALDVLDAVAEGWTEPTTAYLTAYQALTQDMADMQRLFGYLKEGKNPFGYEAHYVPFMPIELGVEFPDPNFERWYERAMHDPWVGYDKALEEYSKFEENTRLLDNDAEALNLALEDLRIEYEERLVEICGADGTVPDLAGCHLNEAGTMDDQFYAIQQAEIRVQKVRLQMENQLGLIRIEQQRAAQVANIHRATAVMYTETGEELASLARQEVELDQAGGWCDMLGGIFEGAWSKASTGTSFGPYGAIIGGAVGALLECGSIIEAEVTAPEMDLADIKERREEIKAYQQARVEYAEADIEDANSEALIKQYMLEYAELKLDLAIAINELEQELARLRGMSAQVEYLLARWNEANRDYTELYSDLGARVLRDMYAEEARHYFEAALESAHLAGRALDYEMAEPWSGEDDVYRIVALDGQANLDGHLGDMWATYAEWYGVSPQQRDTAIRLSEAMGFVDSEEMVAGEPVTVTAEEKFQRYVSDPDNWVDRDNDGTPESLELVFQTTLFADPPEFFSNNVYNDKIRFFYVVLWGDENGLDPDGNDTYVMVRQEGTSFIRDGDAQPLTEVDSVREYNLEPSRSYSPKAIYNRKPNFGGDTSYRSHGLYWRSVACTKWVVTIDRERDPANDDLDLAALEEIEVYISQRNFPLPTTATAEGEAKPSSGGEGGASEAPEKVSAAVIVEDEVPLISLLPLAAEADVARRFAGTVVPEEPWRLPPLELALLLEESGSSVSGAIEAEGLLGYPVLDPVSGLGLALHGTVADGHYALTSDPFDAFGGTAGYQRQLSLTTTSVTTSTISGEVMETITGLVPQGLEIRGAFTLTRSLDDPLAGFSAKPSTGPAPLVVQFTDSSLGEPTSWEWDFGDGHSSTAQNPEHTYAVSGVYDVSLTVTNPFGSDTHVETTAIEVTGLAAPVAYFDAGPRSGIVPLTVDFEDGSAGGPTAWAWDFGDGGTSTAQNPSHEYTTSGAYTVTLTVTNTLGSNTRVEPNYISVREPVAPVADFSADRTWGLAPLLVSFTDQSLNDPTAWAWDFGDGGSSTVRNPQHTYETPGVYTVTQTVANAQGDDTLMKPEYITVEAGQKVYLPLVLRNASTH